MTDIPGDSSLKKTDADEKALAPMTKIINPLDVVSHRPARLFLLLGGFFVANALVAEFIGVKIFALEPTLGIPSFNFNLFGEVGALQFSAGVLLWPVVFLMTDVINEYYGKRGIRFLSYLTVGLIVYSFFMIYGAIQLAPAGFWVEQNASRGVPDMQAAFSTVLGQGLLIIVGSVTAFLIGQMVDVVAFHWIKRATGEKMVWLRATGSTLISQLVDSFVVLFVAFKLGPEITGTNYSLGLEPAICGGYCAVCLQVHCRHFAYAINLSGSCPDRPISSAMSWPIR